MSAEKRECQAALDALTDCFVQLVEAPMEVRWLAGQLLSARIITLNQLEEAQSLLTPGTEKQRRQTLLTVLLRKVTHDIQSFDRFLDILRDDPGLTVYVNRIQKSYESHLEQQPPPATMIPVTSPAQATILDSFTAVPTQTQASSDPLFTQTRNSSGPLLAQAQTSSGPLVTQTSSSPLRTPTQPDCHALLARNQANSGVLPTQIPGSYVVPPIQMLASSGLIHAEMQPSYSTQPSQMQASSGLVPTQMQASYSLPLSREHDILGHSVLVPEAGAEVIMRRELGRKAKGIVLSYANELPGQLKAILVPVKGMLVQEGIIENDSIDLGTLGVPAQLNADKLYNTIITSLEHNPSKFPKLVNILKSFPTLTTVAKELEEAGKSAGLFGGDDGSKHTQSSVEDFEPPTKKHCTQADVIGLVCDSTTTSLGPFRATGSSQPITPMPSPATQVHKLSPPIPNYDSHLGSFQQITSASTSTLTESQTTSSSDSPLPMNLCFNLPVLVKKYVSYIKACYKETIFPDYLKYPSLMLSTASQYIKLALVKNEIKCVKQEKVVRTIELKREGKIEELCRIRGEISITDLGRLPDGSIPTRILVQGAPGIGKTTFSWELCRQWAAGVLLQHFSIVIMLQVRIESIMQAKNLEELITHHNPEVRKALCSYLDDENGKGLLLILEGFDEVLQTKLSKEHVIHQLLMKKVLPSATILVTTRPVATNELPSSFLKHINQHLEILGFTEKEIDAYIQSSCKDEPDLLKDFRSYLSTHPFAASVMCIPLQCAIITELYSNKWHSGEKHFAPQTLTELYTDLVKTLMVRYLSEHAIYSQEEQSIQTLSDLPKKVYKQLMQLAKLAAEGIEQHRYMFRKLPCDTMGLMHREQGLQLLNVVSTSYSFLHLTLQEYLSALYWSQQSSQELVQLMKKPDLFPIEMLVKEGIHNEEKSIIYHWPVLMFIAGLTQLKGIPSEVFTSLFKFDHDEYIQTHDFSSSLCHLLFEAQDSERVAVTFASGKFNALLNTTFDAYTLAYTISNSSFSASWWLACTKIDHLQMLLEGLKCFPPTEESGRIKTVLMSNSSIAPYVRMLPQLSQYTNEVTHLVLEKCELAFAQGKECDENLQQIHTYFPKVELLYIESDSECFWWPILASLSRMNNLRDVTFKIPATNKLSTPLPDQHIPTLSKIAIFYQLGLYTPLLVPNAQTLETLFLYRCHFSGSELTSLTYVLLHLTKLQMLRLKYNTIEEFKQIAAAIANSKSLKRVDLVSNTLQFAGAQEMTTILTHNKILQVLLIGDTTIRYEGSKLLGQVMRKSSVQKLFIPHEHYEWIKESHSHLIPMERLAIADPP